MRDQFPVTTVVQQTVLFLVDASMNSFWVLLFIIYLLFEYRKIPENSLRYKIDQNIQRYIGLKAMISFAVGIGTYIFLGPILRVKMAHMFSVLSFLFNFIPVTGPIIATFIPLPIVLLQPELGTGGKILAFAGPTGVHLVIGNIIEPILFGDKLELHPVIILICLAFWYSVWGISGAVLSVPMTAVFRIILIEINHPYAQGAALVLEGKTDGFFSTSVKSNKGGQHEE